MEAIPIRRFDSHLKEPKFLGNFDIRNLDKLLAGNDLVQEFHRHDFYFILALDKGNGYHEIDFISYPVDDQSLYFMYPGQVHRLNLKAGNTGFLMRFTAEFYNPRKKEAGVLLGSHAGGNVCRPGAERYMRLKHILEYISKEFTDKEEGYLEIIRANLGIFFVELLRQRKSAEKPSTVTGFYPSARLEEFLELLGQHVPSHKQAVQYAEMMRLSPSQLNAITRKTLGKSSSEVIRDYILLEARRYLLATPNQVKEISYHLGYDDVSYFIRFFRKHTGYSPKVYRNIFR